MRTEKTDAIYDLVWDFHSDRKKSYTRYRRVLSALEKLGLSDDERITSLEFLCYFHGGRPLPWLQYQMDRRGIK